MSDGGTAEGAPGAAPPGILDRPNLAVDLSFTGIDGDGAWGILDQQGAYLGRVQIDHGLGRSGWAQVEDAAGTVLVRVDRAGKLGSAPVNQVRDAWGRPAGAIRGSGRIALQAPTSPDPAAELATWGFADLDTSWGLGGSGATPAPGHSQITTHDGRLVGGVQIIEARQQGEKSWLLLDRDPALTEPMRTLVVAYLPVIAFELALARSTQRAGQHRMQRKQRGY